jgi:hypothetical protein
MGGENSSSMLPAFLMEQCAGFPLWQYLLILLVIVLAVYYAKVKWYKHKSESKPKGENVAYGEYYY